MFLKQILGKCAQASLVNAPYCQLGKSCPNSKKGFFISLVEYSHTETYTSRSSTLSLPPRPRRRQHRRPAMAAVAATADPPTYFVGRPLHYEGQQPQAPVPPPPPAAAGQNAGNAQVPGYYAGPTQGRRNAATEHSNPAESTAVQRSQEPGFLARWFGCFSGSSGNAN